MARSHQTVPAGARDRLTAPASLLSPAEVAIFLSVPLRTVYRWRSYGDGPRGYRVGRHVRYRVEDVEGWLDARRDPS